MAAACPNAFLFPGTSTTNPTVRLLRALYTAGEREHGQGARDKMVHALGNLAALAPGSSVRSLALKACERYAASSGSNDDSATRRAASAAIRAIVVRASKQLTDGGPNDIWCRKVLPMAYLGQKDKEPKIAAVWKEVWEEGEPATNASQKKRDGILMQEKLLGDLVQASVLALQDVSWDRRTTGARSIIELCDLRVLAPATDMPMSKRAEKRAKASVIALSACVQVMMKPRIWTGKHLVLKAAVKIACQWSLSTSATSEVGSSPTLLSPIVHSNDETTNDLFEGDGWFTNDAVPIDDDDDDDNEDSNHPDNDDAQKDNKGGDNVDSDGTNNDSMVDTDMEDGTEDTSNGVNHQKRTERAEQQEQRPVAFAGLCKALLSIGVSKLASAQKFGSEELLPFQAGAFEGIASLLKSLRPETHNEQIKRVHGLVYEKLLIIVDNTGCQTTGSPGDKGPPPLVVAKAVDTLAASIWNGYGEDNEHEVTDLAKIFAQIGGRTQPAWTVREASNHAAATLVSRCHDKVLRGYGFVTILLDCTKQALKDRKFWRVRYVPLHVRVE